MVETLLSVAWMRNWLETTKLLQTYQVEETKEKLIKKFSLKTIITIVH